MLVASIPLWAVTIYTIAVDTIAGYHFSNSVAQSVNVANYDVSLLVTTLVLFGGGIKALTAIVPKIQKRSKNLVSDLSSSCLTIFHTPALNKPLSEAGPRPLLSPCTLPRCRRLMLVRPSHRLHAGVKPRVACLPHKSPPSQSTETEAP